MLELVVLLGFRFHCFIFENLHVVMKNMITMSFNKNII